LRPDIPVRSGERLRLPLINAAHRRPGYAIVLH
jgi:hypothetical protein